AVVLLKVSGQDSFTPSAFWPEKPYDFSELAGHAAAALAQELIPENLLI
ncbi:MAG: hypothetical protein GY934_02160, partial [Gammaproteobacteria bacterium]|nr:hypothetical protein [Gammaproteobacteria bacterium]